MTVEPFLIVSKVDKPDPVEQIYIVKRGCVFPQGSGEDVVSDQWLEPFVIVGEDDKQIGSIEDGDSVIIFNFRAGEACFVC